MLRNQAYEQSEARLIEVYGCLIDQAGKKEYTKSTNFLLSNIIDTQLVKSTPKGQITLPKKWRSKFKTDMFVLQITDDGIAVKPVDINELTAKEEVLFDADRDNEGKGVSMDQMITLLQKIKRERN